MQPAGLVQSVFGFQNIILAEAIHGVVGRANALRIGGRRGGAVARKPRGRLRKDEWRGEGNESIVLLSSSVRVVVFYWNRAIYYRIWRHKSRITQH